MAENDKAVKHNSILINEATIQILLETACDKLISRIDYLSFYELNELHANIILMDNLLSNKKEDLIKKHDEGQKAKIETKGK